MARSIMLHRLQMLWEWLGILEQQLCFLTSEELNSRKKKDFGEIYDVKKFVANAVVQVAKVQPTEISSMKFTAMRVLHMVSEDFITSKIEPIFRTKRNLRLTTYFDSLSMAKLRETMLSNGWISLPGYIWKSQVTSGRFVAVDLRFDMLGKKRLHEYVDSSICCHNAKEIGEFLKKIGFHKETTIYLTQTGCLSRLDELRNISPNTFAKVMHALLICVSNFSRRNYSF